MFHWHDLKFSKEPDATKSAASLIREVILMWPMWFCFSLCSFQPVCLPNPFPFVMMLSVFLALLFEELVGGDSRAGSKPSI